MSPTSAPAVKVEHPPARPVLVFDGDCAFCRVWVGRWRAGAQSRLDFEPTSSVRERFPEIAGATAEAVHLVDTDGTATRGAQAVLRARRIAGAGSILARACEDMPVLARTSEAAYRVVARNRAVLSVLTRCLWAGHTERPSFATAVWVFLRVLGAVYAVAFLSLWVQIEGLIGPDGILPAGEFLRNVSAHAGLERFWFLPSLAWIGGTGWFLHALCLAGVGAGLLVAAGRYQRIALAVAWACYLSLVSVGQDFMSFQWDILLLDAGFVSLFLAGPGRRAGWRASAPSRLGLLLAKWLLFRLIFLSGVVKLASGDPAWRSLDALKYHFATQPLPTWIGWAAHQSPDFLLTAACAVMFAIELVLPFFIWAPRRLRHFACAGFLVLQVLILLTGNYTFFNWLTIALCLLLLSDDAWPALLRARVINAASAPPSDNTWVRATVSIAAGLLLFTSAARIPYAFGARWSPPSPVAYILQAFAPFKIGNNYGLFAVMTVERPEIIIQGSMDGRLWESYEFKWKPGDPSRRPRFVAPHQPRLDWQMWFAALGDLRDSPWFLRFARRLLEGEPSVVGLLDHDPFDGKPPRFVRAVIYDYTFSTPGGRWSRGRWWNQGTPDIFMPPVSLSDFERR